MKYPKCKNLDTKVIDSRATEDGKAIRRRECEKCGARFTTFERLEFVSFMVTKSSGETEQYDRAKIVNSMMKALVKREFRLHYNSDFSCLSPSSLPKSSEFSEKYRFSGVFVFCETDFFDYF